MTGVQIGYRVVLPPGWVRLSLRDDPGASVDAILDRSFSQLPADKYGPFRAELRKKVMAHLAAARDNEAIDLYVPIERMHDVTVPASFVVALLQFDSVEVPEPEDVLVAYAAQQDGSEIREVDGSPALRTERVVPGDSGAEDESQFASRRVDYLIAIPEGADRWLTVSFGTVGDGDADGELARVLVELFDAVMSTFRWTRG